MTAKSEYKEKAPCAEKDTPVPECVVCSQCGQDIEIWTDEEQAICPVCGKAVMR